MYLSLECESPELEDVQALIGLFMVSSTESKDRVSTECVSLGARRVWMDVTVLTAETQDLPGKAQNPHEVTRVFCFTFIFKDFYLFIHERHRDRGRDPGRGRSRLHAREPDDMGLDPGTQGSCPGPKADAQPLSHPGIPIRALIIKVGTRRRK